MKIFFIIPPDIHYIEPYAYKVADKSNTGRIHLGLLYVAAYLRQHTGITPRIIDATVDGLGLDDIRRIITEEKPDIVGMSVLTFNLLNCLQVSEIIKAVSPGTKVCYGGWHPTLYPKETLSLPSVDMIALGEGEETFTELVKNGLSPAGIPGLGYKERAADGTEKLVLTGPRQPIQDLDSIPFPAYDLVDISKYSNLLASDKRSITITASRGCPHACIFCDIRRTKYRFRSAKNILSEIDLYYKKGITEFFIQDDNFTIDRRRILEFCRLLTEGGYRIKYKISSRVDSLDNETMSVLRQSGCYRIYFGVESGSQRLLDYLEKGIKVEDIRRSFRLAEKYGIDACAYIMIGIPGETPEDIDLTRKLLKDIRPAHLHCSICTPMPATVLYNKLLAEKRFTSDYWLEFARKPNKDFKTPFALTEVPAEELRALQNSIQKQFYMNPAIVLRELIKTRDLSSLLSKFKVALKIFTK